MAATRSSPLRCTAAWLIEVAGLQLGRVSLHMLALAKRIDPWSPAVIDKLRAAAAREWAARR